MERVVILGGGFAGLAAANVLGDRRSVQCILVDQRETFDFLPMIPDVVGGRIDGDLLLCRHDYLADRLGFTFCHGAVTEVDLAARRVVTGNSSLDYDYLIIASGTQANFFDRPDVREHAYAVESVAGARRLHRALLDCRTVVVCGGGYTGVEVATNVRALFSRAGCGAGIVLVERDDALVSHLPPWLRDYVKNNVEEMDIDVRLGTTVASVDGRNVTLQGGQTITDAILVWSAGVQTAPYVRRLPVPKSETGGRLKVDSCLRVDRTCFAAGDVAGFVHRGRHLRMSVQFSISQGRCAAHNVLAVVARGPLRPFRPFDPGYLVPMANGRSGGKVLGLTVWGLPATLLHYFVSIVRSCGWTNRLGLLKQLLSGRLTRT